MMFSHPAGQGLTRSHGPWVILTRDGAANSVPVSQDLLGFFYFLFRAGKVKFDFPRPASNDNFYGCEAAPLHSQVELLVSFVRAVTL